MWDNVWILPLAVINPDATIFPLALTFPCTIDPELNILPEAVMFVNAWVDIFVSWEPSPIKPPVDVIVPLALILPEAVMCAKLAKFYTSLPEPEP